MLLKSGLTQHTHVFYDLPQAAAQLGMSETVLVRLSQYFKIPALAYEEEGYLSFKGELQFSEPDLRFFKMARERLVSGATLDQVKRELEIASGILPQSLGLPVTHHAPEAAQSLQPVQEPLQDEITTEPLELMPLPPIPGQFLIQEPLQAPLPAVAHTENTIEGSIKDALVAQATQAAPEITEKPLEPTPPVPTGYLGTPKPFQNPAFQNQPPRPAFQRQTFPTPDAAAQASQLVPPVSKAAGQGFPAPQVSNHHILKSMIYAQQNQQQQQVSPQQSPPQRQSLQVQAEQYRPQYDKASYVSQPGNPASGYNRWQQAGPPEAHTAHQTEMNEVIDQSFKLFGQNPTGAPAGLFPHPAPPKPSQAKQTPGLSYAVREVLAPHQPTHYPHQTSLAPGHPGEYPQAYTYEDALSDLYPQQ